MEGNNIWMANRYVTSTPTDGGKTRIPTLTKLNPDSSKASASTNAEKSQMIAQALFPNPPLDDHIPTDFIYPDPITAHTPFNQDQIQKAITNLSGYKAPGLDGICNIVFKKCSELLTPYFTFLFNGVFSHQTYYEPWKRFMTVIL
jgi:hypothetical protein